MSCNKCYKLSLHKVTLKSFREMALDKKCHQGPSKWTLSSSKHPSGKTLKLCVWLRQTQVNLIIYLHFGVILSYSAPTDIGPFPEIFLGKIFYKLLFIFFNAYGLYLKNNIKQNQTIITLYFGVVFG